MADCWQSQASVAGPYWISPGNQPCLRTSTFRDLMYAFPRPKHTSRVMKPRSAGNSPSSAAKRRATTSHTSPMYRQLPLQSYQAQIQAALAASAMRRTRQPRPMSWHPASMRSTGYSTPQYLPSTTTSENLAGSGLCASSSNTVPVTYQGEDILPVYPASDAAMFSSLSGMEDQTIVQQQYILQTNGSQAEPVTWDASVSSLSAMALPMSEGWSFDMMSMNSSIPGADVAGSNYESAPSSGPPTPFLPIQQFDEPEAVEEKPEDELVGMGLYSHPDTSLNASLTGLSGKGLKLEETFTPSPDDETENQDADGEDDDSQETAEKQASNSADLHQPQLEPQTHAQPVKSAQNMLNKSFFFEDDGGLDQDGDGGVTTQQFFGLENQPCMNYAYRWI
ncbi:hypothetical protein KXV70_007528 [Aspergillus fumigatus]|nr:hypothetical protein KXX64_007995 [Aspergillus fumigatus]KAH2163735.1 hypothetical protein KXW33_004925 [Aspergillus fumigatus]KAH2469022.1 hypothetical protein KXW63_008480 [Aspergillus fumigatus]KAH2564001.1 hypothetical protein KXV70_007528 [Aspergillus fumigatus]KAH2962314.1 hypothetical protein KXV49_006210 [Aspergillus fumigatus]